MPLFHCCAASIQLCPAKTQTAHGTDDFGCDAAFLRNTFRSNQLIGDTSAYEVPRSEPASMHVHEISYPCSRYLAADNSPSRKVRRVPTSRTVVTPTGSMHGRVIAVPSSHPKASSGNPCDRLVLCAAKCAPADTSQLLTAGGTDAHCCAAVTSVAEPSNSAGSIPAAEFVPTSAPVRPPQRLTQHKQPHASTRIHEQKCDKLQPANGWGCMPGGSDKSGDCAVPTAAGCASKPSLRREQIIACLLDADNFQPAYTAEAVADSACRGTWASGMSTDVQVSTAMGPSVLPASCLCTVEFNASSMQPISNSSHHASAAHSSQREHAIVKQWSGTTCNNNEPLYQQVGHSLSSGAGRHAKKETALDIQRYSVIQPVCLFFRLCHLCSG